MPSFTGSSTYIAIALANMIYFYSWSLDALYEIWLFFMLLQQNPLFHIAKAFFPCACQTAHYKLTLNAPVMILFFSFRIRSWYRFQLFNFTYLSFLLQNHNINFIVFEVLMPYITLHISLKLRIVPWNKGLYKRHIKISNSVGAFEINLLHFFSFKVVNM